MKMPGFSAENALGKATRSYRTNYAPNAARRNGASLVPSQFMGEDAAGDLDEGLNGMDESFDDGDFGSEDDGDSAGDEDE